MHTRLRQAFAFGLITVVAVVGVAPSAFGDDSRDDRRERRREIRERWGERRERWEDRREREREWERRREAERRHWEWRREWERRRELERHRAAIHWRFERDRGWRWEHRPGVWSPFFVWWVIEGRPLLRPYPTARIVQYPTGYYELMGNGITEPFYWVWRPTVVVASPPPVPLPPPPPAEYPLPPEGAYPPPPPIPQG